MSVVNCFPQKGRMNSLKTNFIYSSILTTANYLFPLVVFPYVSRVLGVTNYGICNFIDSIINYYVLFSMMGINIVGIREIARCKNQQGQLNDTFNNLFLLNTFTTLLALLVLLVTTLLSTQLRIHWQMMSIGAFKLLFNYMLIEWFYKGLEEFRFITIRTLIVKLLYVVSVFFLVRDSEDYTVYYFLSVMMIVLNAIINIIYSRHYITFSIKIDIKRIKQFVQPFFSLGIYILLTSMYTSFNVAFLGFVAGETEVGYYSAATKLYKVLIALFSAFTGVMLPRMSSLIAEGKISEFKMMLHKSNNLLFTFAVPFVLLSVAYAPTLIVIFAGSGYEGAITPMRIMMPLTLIIGYEQILVIQTLMPLKKDNSILYNSIVGATIGLVLNILLVFSLRSTGSAIVWFVSEISVLVGAQYIVYKNIHVGFPVKLLFENILINIPLLIMILAIKFYIINLWTSLIMSMILSMVYFFISQVYILKNADMRQELKKINIRIKSYWGEK